MRTPAKSCLFAFLAMVVSASHGQVERTATGVRLVQNGRIVWNFEIDTEDGKPYVHPLATPSGVVLTDLRPDDHPWHGPRDAEDAAEFH